MTTPETPGMNSQTAPPHAKPIALGIGQIEISNFRACESLSLPLAALTPLVGQNNSGKTTILDAIAWVLKPSTVPGADFRDDGVMTVDARIDGVTKEILDQIPAANHRAAISEYCIDGVIWIRAHASKSNPKPIREIWGSGETDESGKPTSWRSFPTGLPNAINAMFPEVIRVNALDDLDEDLGKSKSGTTIKALLDQIMEGFFDDHPELVTALETVNSYFSQSGTRRSSRFLDFDTEASASLTRFFPASTCTLTSNLSRRVIFSEQQISSFPTLVRLKNVNSTT
jgi:putative ATP-dependent endonuclease of OLD family